MATTLNSAFRLLPRTIEEPVRQHLKNVYACLTLSAISAAVGSYLYVFANFSLGVLSGLVGLGLMIALMSTPYNGKNSLLRLGYLLGFSFFVGMEMGPLIQYAADINPSVILSAFLGTSFIFASFTLSVLYAKRGYWLFLFGPLCALGSILVLLSLGNIFFGSYWIYQMNIYVGLMVMCGFVLFDTTVIIEKFRMGDKDFVIHALDLFVDFIGIFKRILIILIAKERNARDRKRN